MDKLQGTIGLAVRARKTATGDQVIKSIQSKTAKLVLISDTCGNNGRKKLMDKCNFYEVPFVFVPDEILSLSTGMSNRKSIAILDDGFAQNVVVCLKG